MAKNKDPAVLFYTADFLVGVSDLTMEERGQYITLLCLHHQQGHLSEKAIALAVGKASADVLAKFEVDENGLLYQHRMDEESEKREAYLLRQYNNGIKGGRPKNPRDNPDETHRLTQTKPKANPTHNPNKSARVENENENINVIKDVIDYLNSKLNTKYQYKADYIQRHINARLSEGYGFEDFKTVIDKKYREWSGTEFAKFLRPETLFGTKFVQYLNQLEATERSKEMATPQPIIHEAKYNTFDPEEALERALARTYYQEQE